MYFFENVSEWWGASTQALLLLRLVFSTLRFAGNAGNLTCGFVVFCSMPLNATAIVSFNQLISFAAPLSHMNNTARFQNVFFDYIFYPLPIFATILFFLLSKKSRILEHLLTSGNYR